MTILDYVFLTGLKYKISRVSDVCQCGLENVNIFSLMKLNIGSFKFLAACATRNCKAILSFRVGVGKAVLVLRLQVEIHENRPSHVQL